jgi:hypothetical protein
MVADDAEELTLLVSQARVADPSIEEVPGRALARLALEALAADPGMDAVDLARQLVAAHPEADASWVNVIALEASRRVG